jgi:hypothetical protein
MSQILRVFVHAIRHTLQDAGVIDQWSLFESQILQLDFQCNDARLWKVLYSYRLTGSEARC